MRHIEHLYHLAEADNIDSIVEHGLLSTERLLGLAGMAEQDRVTLLRTHRPDCLRLSDTVLIRDQRPMPPHALARALDDGLEPGDWFALLNKHVFLWPDRERMTRHLNACGGRPQILLTYDAAALFGELGDEAFVSPINSGNARRKPARRGLTTFAPYRDWLKEGWPTGERTRAPAEVLFRCPIPTRAPYLIDIAGV